VRVQTPRQESDDRLHLYHARAVEDEVVVLTTELAFDTGLGQPAEAESSIRAVCDGWGSENQIFFGHLERLLLFPRSRRRVELAKEQHNITYFGWFVNRYKLQVLGKLSYSSPRLVRLGRKVLDYCLGLTNFFIAALYVVH